jgi:hypothetical protein
MSGAPTISLHVYGVLRQYCAGAEQIPISARSVREALVTLERERNELYRNMCDETGAVRRHMLEAMTDFFEKTLK